MNTQDITDTYRKEILDFCRDPTPEYIEAELALQLGTRAKTLGRARAIIEANRQRVEEILDDLDKLDARVAAAEAGLVGDPAEIETVAMADLYEVDKIELAARSIRYNEPRMEYPAQPVRLTPKGSIEELPPPPPIVVSAVTWVRQPNGSLVLEPA